MFNATIDGTPCTFMKYGVSSFGVLPQAKGFLYTHGIRRIRLRDITLSEKFLFDIHIGNSNRSSVVKDEIIAWRSSKSSSSLADAQGLAPRDLSILF